MPGPRRRLLSPRSWVWLGIGTLVLLRVLTLSRAEGQRSFTVEPLVAGPCRVVRVVSGDTLVVVQPPRAGEVVIRLLSTQAIAPGEDTALAESAARFAREFVADREVSLRLDNHRLDARGRYLAYVEAEGLQLNEQLIAAGLARYVDFPGNSASVERRLRDAEASAKSNRLGCWQ